MATARDHLALASGYLLLAEQKLKIAHKASTGTANSIELRAEASTHYRQADHYNLAAIAAALVDLSGPDIDLKTQTLVDDLDLPTNDEGPAVASAEPSA